MTHAVPSGADVFFDGMGRNCSAEMTLDTSAPLTLPTVAASGANRRGGADECCEIRADDRMPAAVAVPVRAAEAGRCAGCGANDVGNVCS